MLLHLFNEKTASTDALSRRSNWLWRKAAQVLELKRNPNKWHHLLWEEDETSETWFYCAVLWFPMKRGTLLIITSRFSFVSYRSEHIPFECKIMDKTFDKFPEEFFDIRVKKFIKKFSKNYDKISLTERPLTFASQELFYDEKKKAFIEKYSRKDLKKYLVKGLKEHLDKYLEDVPNDRFNKTLKKIIMLQMDEYLDIYLDYLYTKWLDDLIRDKKK